MTNEELQAEIDRLAVEIERSASSEGERDVLRQKRLLARSYAVRGSAFPPGTYRVEGDERLFSLKYINGVMGWGTWADGEEGAVPLAALQSGT